MRFGTQTDHYTPSNYVQNIVFNRITNIKILHIKLIVNNLMYTDRALT